MEQQLSTGAGGRQVAELIEHDHVDAGELGGYVPGLADPDLLLEPVHTWASAGLVDLHSAHPKKARTSNIFLAHGEPLSTSDRIWPRGVGHNVRVVGDDDTARRLFVKQPADLLLLDLSRSPTT